MGNVSKIVNFKISVVSFDLMHCAFIILSAFIMNFMSSKTLTKFEYEMRDKSS